MASCEPCATARLSHDLPGLGPDRDGVKPIPPQACVTVGNRLGGGGRIATKAVMRAPPDGNTLLLASSVTQLPGHHHPADL